jgi:hypothetical protein
MVRWVWHVARTDMIKLIFFFFPCGSTAQFWALAASMKLSVSFQFLDLGQSAGLLGRVISSSQGLCWLQRVIVMMEKSVEWPALAGEPEVLGENLPRRHFVHHKSHLPGPDANSGRRGAKPATNRFSYGAAMIKFIENINPKALREEIISRHSVDWSRHNIKTNPKQVGCENMDLFKMWSSGGL